MESIELCIEDVNVEKFWEVADDLLYTKMYYDRDTKLYFTKRRENDDKNDNDDDIKEEEMNTLLVSYIALIVKYYDGVAHLYDTEQIFLEKVSEFLLAFPGFISNYDFCVRKLASLICYAAKNTTTIPTQSNETLLIVKVVGWILHSDGEGTIEVIMKCGGVEAISKSISLFNNNTKSVFNGIIRVIIDIFKKDLKQGYVIASYFAPSTVQNIADSLRVRSRAEDESNYICFILTLLLFYYNDEVVNIILHSPKRTAVFTELLVLVFNRDDDQLLQRHVAIALSRTASRLYTNDCKVVVDILLRKLQEGADLSIDNDALIISYVSLLHHLLIESELSNHRYKSQEIAHVLSVLINCEHSSLDIKIQARELLQNHNTIVSQPSTPPHRNSLHNPHSASLPDLTNVRAPSQSHTHTQSQSQILQPPRPPPPRRKALSHRHT